VSLIEVASHQLNDGPSQKVIYPERPISKVYKGLDNDLARDNMENDLS